MLRMPSEPQWSRLFHAYGLATDTPRHLAALVGGDERARADALRHLCGAVIHQGTPWSATAPAALAVAALLHDPRLNGANRHPLNFQESAPPTRASLLDFLAMVGEASEYGVAEEDLATQAHPPGRDGDVDRAMEAILAGSDDPWTDEAVVNAIEARAVLGCRRVAPELFAAAVTQLDYPDPRVRVSAANAVRALIRHPALIGRREEIIARLSNAAAKAGVDERAGLVLTIGQLGGVPRRFLADPHPGVRACAALAPALAGDPKATAEILAALRDPVAIDGWFQNCLPQLDGRIRFALLDAALARVPHFDTLVPAAVALVRTATALTVDRDWGRLLVAAFPEPPGASRPLTAAQRQFLAALVDNDELWDRRHGNSVGWFREAGLPYDRAACARLLRQR
jgi:hypothetical protein